MVLTTPYIGAGSRAYRGGGERAPAVAGELHLVNFLVRREWFEKVGGLSEALGYGGEDTEFLYQASKLGAKFCFDPDLTVTHRRRPFGVEYAKQRFRLRLQSARLWGAFPEIYSSNRSFQHLGQAVSMAAVIALLVLIYFRLPGLVLLALFYAILVMALSFPRWRSRLEIAPLAPFAFFIHHAVNLTGFSIGVARELIKGQGEMR
jgi:GT2 family glycosyltransferase